MFDIRQDSGCDMSLGCLTYSHASEADWCCYEYRGIRVFLILWNPVMWKQVSRKVENVMMARY